MQVMLTKNFSLDEMIHSDTARARGIDNTPTEDIIDCLRETALLLEDIRWLLKTPIIVTSGYRSPALNRAIGGSMNSDHMLGRAADFQSPQFGTPLNICRAIEMSGMMFHQLIHEFDSWVHISWSPDPRQEILTINNSGTKRGL